MTHSRFTLLLLFAALSLGPMVSPAFGAGSIPPNPPPADPSPTDPSPTDPPPTEPEPEPEPEPPISGGEDDGEEQDYEIPNDQTGLSPAPLNVVSRVPPNVLLILDNSESGQEGLDGRVALGNNQQDRENLQACQPDTFNAAQCPAGARSPLSKSSIMKSVGRDLIERYRGDLNLGLMAYQQNPASLTRDSAFSERTVVWRLTERALEPRYSTSANPRWYDPEFEGAWNASTKRFRARLPGLGIYAFFNVGVPGYMFEESFNTGLPRNDVTEYWRRISMPTASSDQVSERYRSLTNGFSSSPAIGDGISYRLPVNSSYSLPLVDSLRQRGISNWGGAYSFITT